MSRLTLLLFTAALLVLAPGAHALVTAGEHVAETFETAHPYIPSGADEPVLTWWNEIYFPGATYIAPHFSKFQLAKGDYLVIRSPDGKQSWTYTDLGKNGLGLNPDGFFAVHIKGERAILELYTGDSEGAYGFTIDRYGRGYSDEEIIQFWNAGLGDKMNLPMPPSIEESLCGTDDSREAKCYRGSETQAYHEARATIRLLLNGGSWCTAWLVGTEGHILTNEHCITSQAQLDNIDFEFMAEGPNCATDCRSSLACSGTIEASGGTFIQDNAGLDYALMLPDTSVGTLTPKELADEYGFMTLRASGPVLEERLYIPQHPAGWGKRIAMESTYPADTTLGGHTYANSLTEVACTGGGPGDVGYWADTQGGSSGSPVLGYSDHQIIAIHHCRGSAFCTNPDPNIADPNRGVPVQSLIADMAGNLPPNSIRQFHGHFEDGDFGEWDGSNLP